MVEKTKGNQEQKQKCYLYDYYGDNRHKTGVIEPHREGKWPSCIGGDKTLLVKSGLSPALKEKLSSRALNAEEDIKAGRVYTREEYEKRLDSRLDL